ncbi:MAG: heme-binding protein, partial [Planctomycetales bacterium]|nr:heme-binding protein [Planctomycetales bacterium]
APAGANATAAEVADLLDRASAATASTDAIIAIVDRGGRILGVRVESGVALPDLATTIFAIDGAVAKARTAAFFASNEAPLTSRTIRILSQSTITQREVESNPNDPDPASTTRGPGFVAPIGLGGHFPPGVMHTPPVDLFDIEHTNRDSSVHPGADLVKGTADDVPLSARFNIDPAFVPAGQSLEAPESYGFTSGLMPSAQSRGIATLPGGVPLYRNGSLVGGIGVFFPGSDGYATHEQNFVAGVGQSEYDRTNAPKVLESEFIAFAAAGGSADAEIYIPTTPGYTLPDLDEGRIDLVGITLEVIGPLNLELGVPAVLDVGRRIGAGAVNGSNATLGAVFTRDGVTVPDGWLVTPHDSTIPGDATAAEVTQIITQGIVEADLVRAAIRLPFSTRTKMVFSVTDTGGNVLGLYRMSDATVFSIDVAVSKARNVAYYADASALVAADRIDVDHDGTFDAPLGTAFSNRTFRFLAEPRYPSGVDGTTPPSFSILLTPGINSATGENSGAPLPASAFTTVAAFDAFNPGSNFRDPGNIANQSGIVFFPGSTPVYRDGVLRGGFGVSGDGVDQDDVVTFSGAQGFLPPAGVLRADDVTAAGVRLPFIKFLRNPRG